MEAAEGKKFGLTSVLIIDDNETDLFVEKNTVLLTAHVQSFHCFTNCSDAINFIRKTKVTRMPELILLDVRMPGISAFRVVSAVERLSRKYGCRSKIILISAFFEIEKDLLKKAGKYGVIAKCVEKPLAAEHLYGIF